MALQQSKDSNVAARDFMQIAQDRDRGRRAPRTLTTQPDHAAVVQFDFEAIFRPACAAQKAGVR